MIVVIRINETEMSEICSTDGEPTSNSPRDFVLKMQRKTHLRLRGSGGRILKSDLRERDFQIAN
jgi:hypothetical protein